MGKAHPYISIAEARSALAVGNRNLRDGDLVPACARMLSCYQDNIDGFNIGFPPETPREFRLLDPLKEGFRRLLPTCLAYSTKKGLAEYLLRMWMEGERSNTTYQSNLALVLSRSSNADERKEARTLLEQLAPRRKIERAEGYAALARLRYEAGDTAGAQAALAVCHTKTRRPNVCPKAEELSTRQPEIVDPD